MSKIKFTIALKELMSIGKESLILTVKLNSLVFAVNHNYNMVSINWFPVFYINNIIPFTYLLTTQMYIHSWNEVRL